MRVIIAGGRDFSNYTKLASSCTRLYTDHYFRSWNEVLCGMAPGADTLGRQWAEAFEIPVKEYPADWPKHGRSAGPIRNQLMSENADMLIAFWDGRSRGTRDMILRAVGKGLGIHVFRY